MIFSLGKENLQFGVFSTVFIHPLVAHATYLKPRTCDFDSVPAVQSFYRRQPMSDQKAPLSALSEGFVLHSCYDTVLRKVDARYDIRGYVLAQMVTLCLQSRGTLPLAHRDFYAQYAQPEAIAFLEMYVTHLLFGPAGRFSPQEYHYQADAHAEPG